MIASRSLFDAPAASPLAEASGWVQGVLLGGAAVGLCVTAVALLGFAMLAGHLPIRRGMLVVAGCFVLLGAPAVARSLLGWSFGAEPGGVASVAGPAVIYERPPLPPVSDNPYARASLRSD